MAGAQRPLSPHLQIYRWQISNSLSILHRFTGILLALGALALVAWLLAVASGQGSYMAVSGLFRSFLGQLLLLGWTFAFFFHFCNGIRHLAWDADLGFDKYAARRTGRVVVAAAIILTLLFWGVALAGGV
jgi:succinate dehydrogenase / fumarate reductase cytochrome b subunit